jgi:hypothetical protein
MAIKDRSCKLRLVVKLGGQMLSLVSSALGCRYPIMDDTVYLLIFAYQNIKNEDSLNV